MSNIDYHALVSRVRRRLGPQHTQVAERALQVSVEGLMAALDDDLRARLFAALPRPLLSTTGGGPLFARIGQPPAFPVLPTKARD